MNYHFCDCSYLLRYFQSPLLEDRTRPEDLPPHLADWPLVLVPDRYRRKVRVGWWLYWISREGQLLYDRRCPRCGTLLPESLLDDPSTDQKPTLKLEIPATVATVATPGLPKITRPLPVVVATPVEQEALV